MIEKVIKYLQSKVSDAGIFQSTLGLTELIEIDGKTFPLIYSDGKYKQDFKPNKWFGLGYFRKRGNVSFAVGTFPDYKACNVPVEVTIPLKFIGTIKKDKLKCDNNYAADNVAFFIAKQFEDINGIRTELSAKRVDYNVGEYTTDAKEVVSQEFAGIEKMWNADYLYLSMDINIIVQTTKGCMFDYCDGVIIDEVPNEVADQNENNLIAR